MLKIRSFVFAAILALIAGISLSAPAQAASVGLSLPSRPKVLLMGDSYTQGVGAVPMTKGYAYQIAAPLNWNLTIDGAGGTGYTKTNGSSRIFSDRLYNHRGNDYDLVILQGSSNDHAADNPTLSGAINTTVKTVHMFYPHAKILFLATVSPWGPVQKGYDRERINYVVTKYAASHGYAYIDPEAEKWFPSGQSATYVNMDNGHPSNAGHHRIAWKFVASVQKLES